MAVDKTPLLQNGKEGPTEAEAPIAYAAYHAALNNNIEMLRRMPKEHLSLKYSNKPRITGQLPIHAAALGNCIPALDFLREINGINPVDDDGCTPLIHAIAKHSFEAVVWLLKHGADPNLTDSQERSAMHWAALLGSATMTSLLVNLGVDPELQSDVEAGRNALTVAAKNNRLEVVEYLVLTVGCSDAALEKAKGAVDSRARSYWVSRCLQSRVGSMEAASRDCSWCGPSAGGCFPSTVLCAYKGSGHLMVHARQLSLFTGVLALVVSAWFLKLAGETSSKIDAEEGLLDLWKIKALAWTSLVSTLIGWVFYARAVLKCPGFADKNDKLAQDRYQRALANAAAVTADDFERQAQNWWGERNPLIHQLKIVGPARSKYCSAIRQCVLEFDHFCQFTRSTIGRDNYADFVGTIVSSEIACICIVTAGYNMVSAGEAIIFSGLSLVYFGVFVVLWFMLITFHCSLIKNNLTTNERLLLADGRHAYLFDEQSGEFDNPYDQGCCANFRSRLCCKRRDNGSVSPAHIGDAEAP